MLGGLIFFGFIVVLVFIIIKSRAKHMNRPKSIILNPAFNEAFPNDLGTINKTDLKSLVDKLDTSLDLNFVKRVKNRVLSQHTDWTEAFFDWNLFELKRFFILTQVLKEVPMFSESVDEIWHEMLMFTEDYQAFCRNFWGDFLHHRPNEVVKPDPDGRAFFDWIYASVFTIEEPSRLIWGNFFKHPLSQDLLNDVSGYSQSSILGRYFSPREDHQEIQTRLIKKLKNQIEVSSNLKGKKKSEFTKAIKAHTPNNLNDSFLLFAVFFSLYDFDHYTSNMNEQLIAYNEHWGIHKLHSTSSNACGSACTSEHQCGSDCGSSCGSSCGSGCGGGD